jgi:hypothetical protein
MSKLGHGQHMLYEGLLKERNACSVLCRHDVGSEHGRAIDTRHDIAAFQIMVHDHSGFAFCGCMQQCPLGGVRLQLDGDRGACAGQEQHPGPQRRDDLERRAAAQHRQRTMTMTYRYVEHHRVHDFALCGWHIADTLNDTPHGQYSILMVWLCDCPCVVPRGL